MGDYGSVCQGYFGIEKKFKDKVEHTPKTQAYFVYLITFNF